MRKSFGMLLLIIVTSLFVGCGGSSDSNSSSSSGSDANTYTGLDSVTALSSAQLDVPLRSNVAGFCYLESFSMQIAYLKPNISRAKVFAYALFGAPIYWNSYDGALEPNESYVDFNYISALQNLGVDFVLGSGSAAGYGQLEDYASGKLIFSSEDEALETLKKGLTDDRPVQVHIDLSKITTPTNYHPYFLGGDATGGSSHYLVVTGYDESNIYLNEASQDQDPSDGFEDESSVKDFAVPVDVFMEAWEAAGDITDVGPYWMLFFAEKKGVNISDTKTSSEIISIHKTAALNNESIINAHIDELQNTSSIRWFYHKISLLKSLFADYLEEVGYSCDSTAVTKYNELSDHYETLCNVSDGEDGLNTQQAELEDAIGPKETEAANALS
ncbi:MAG: hypothetical protein JRI71_14940 [Deltaproteobacteria bacterium]|nr:hypothetical protein [Deltaproteobacteria bacterium]MBW2311608.1 hypothetical protein [Deltaproteobacteria bacterium]